MRTAHAWNAFLLVLLILAVPLAFAQKEKAPKYDPANEVKIKGPVEEVKQITEGNETETHLVLRTDAGLVEVCLCPAKFLSGLDMNFAKGDEIEVTGAKAKETQNGAEVILARQIVKGTNTLVLRDKQGGPVWTWLMKK